MAGNQQGEPLLVTTSAAGQWRQGVESHITVRGFGQIVMDEPEALGGTDRGPNPMEFVMAALDGCVAVMVKLIAGEIGFQFSDLQLQADGVLDLRGLMGTAEVTRHFREVTLTVTLRTDEPPERLAELRDKVHDRCPAINLLKDAGIDLKANWVAAT